MNALPLACLLLAPVGEGEPPGGAELAKAALAPLNPLVGQWRGVGQVRRGSRAGTWSETAEWVWDFSEPDRPAVRFEVEGGKEVSRLLVRPAPDGGGFLATFTPPGGDPATLAVASLEGTVEFAPAGDGSDRLTLRPLGEKRFTLLIERRSSPAGRFRRVAEVGYTRSGTRLAESSLGGPECVVSGGLGTIEVRHGGKTYYVCCSGCVSAFEADPAGTLEAYRVRKAAERAARLEAARLEAARLEAE